MKYLVEIKFTAEHDKSLTTQNELGRLIRRALRNYLDSTVYDVIRDREPVHIDLSYCLTRGRYAVDVTLHNPRS